ncbi:MAG TPA: glycosyl hydrolase family 28 protein [Edaphobacter sp.]|jgi:hypothetical protein|nr:glycosyl hydrolase family 28 protein [Edaphobacter sp.]
MAKRSKSFITRRSFVRKAGIVAAGSALGCSVGCGANQFLPVLPCLSNVTPPAPAGEMTYIKASEIGCALDCDLSTGRNKYTGGAATDDAPRINAAMAGATASNPITLILDGSALISGLFLPAGGYWSIAGLGCGTGFFIKKGTNNDGIHNGGPRAAVPSDPGTVTPGIPVPARGSSVSLSNFELNGNAGGDSTSGHVQGTSSTWYFGINLMNLNNITLENLGIVNTPAYHIRLSNVGNVTVSGCTTNSSATNTDGVHFDGPANDIAISNCNFTCGDDAIALNCPEGYNGNISRVTVTGCTFNSLTMLRLYTTGGGKTFRIDSVTVSDCSGTLTRAAFAIGEGADSNPNSVDGLTVSNCKIVAPAVLDLEANFGVATFTNVTLTPLDRNQDVGYAFARTSSPYRRILYSGKSLVLENCVIQRNRDHAVAALILDGSRIENIEFNGFSVQDAPGNSYGATPELLNIASGTIKQVAIGSVDSARIKAPIPASRFSNVGSFCGAGVLATGWQFPDSCMANETPYISASTHRPSIKVAGVVRPYP